MPVTPFHMGPAVVVKVMARRHFSLRIFALTQVVIDLESARNLYLHAYPVHRQLHTFVGATFVSALTLVVGRYSFNAVNPFVKRFLSNVEEMPLWVIAELPKISWAAAWIGGMVGGISHVVLDAVIHPDVTPFWPRSTANPFFIEGSFNLMHLACVGVGIVALPLWRGLARSDPQEVTTR